GAAAAGEITGKAPEIDDLARRERLNRVLLRGRGGDGGDELGARTRGLGDEVERLAVAPCRGGEGAARAPARGRPALVVEGGADREAAKDLAIGPANGRVRSEQLLVSLAVDPDVGTAEALGQRHLQRGVESAEVVAAHEAGAVPAEHNRVLVHQDD